MAWHEQRRCSSARRSAPSSSRARPSASVRSSTPPHGRRRAGPAATPFPGRPCPALRARARPQRPASQRPASQRPASQRPASQRPRPQRPRPQRPRPQRPPSPPASASAPRISSASPSSGAAGQIVVVDGSGLYSSTGQVVAYFGGASAPTSCSSQTSCTVTVPDLGTGPSTVPLTIVTTQGRSNALTFAYT
jgi:hypothetical protein